MQRLRQENYFPATVAVHFCMWAIDLSLYSGTFHDADADTFFGAFSMEPGMLHPSRVLGEMFSSWVVTVFAFNFLMATRARWVERVFGGLDKMYLIHRRSGMIAVVLLLAHFVTVPRDLSAFTVGKPLGFWALVLILIGVVLSAAPPLKRRIPYHRWLPIHRLMGVFYVMGIAHAFMVNALIWELPLTRVYVFGMAAVGVGAWGYRLVSRWVKPPHRYTVASRDDLGNGVLSVTLRPDGDGLAFEPGQFAFLTLPSMGAESHPYTLACQPGGELTFWIKSLGDYTERLATELKEGAAALVEGPHGHFDLSHARHRDQVWVAGGIGITPFLALAPAARAHDVRLFWSVPSPETVFGQDQLTAAASETGVDLTVWCSDDRGHLTAEALGTTDWTATSFLLCGPEGLKQALRSQLLAKGVASRDIHDEAFSFR